MIIAETITDIRRAVAAAKADGRTVGLIPTMGALHAGHLSLIDAARETCDYVVVSIFVNPTQFSPGEDLKQYPRTPQEDIAACEAHQVDAVFIPTVEVMYAGGALTQVSVKKLSETLCGRHRPGHFDGVCTVVAKLFNIVGPDKAFFGAKDFQQGVIVRRMVDDLNFPVEVVICPTVRAPDGLAISSRNVHLQDNQRTGALVLHESLQVAERMIHQAHPPAGEVIARMRTHISTRAPEAGVDYIQIVDPLSLQDVVSTDRRVLVALAVRFGGVRLIDNILVE